jgi:hypothetical protein
MRLDRPSPHASYLYSYSSGEDSSSLVDGSLNQAILSNSAVHIEMMEDSDDDERMVSVRGCVRDPRSGGGEAGNEFFFFGRRYATTPVPLSDADEDDEGSTLSFDAFLSAPAASC